MLSLGGRTHKAFQLWLRLKYFIFHQKEEAILSLFSPAPKLEQKLTVKNKFEPHSIFLSSPKQTPSKVCVNSFSEDKGKQLLTQFTLIIMISTLDMSHTDQASCEFGS